MNRKIMSKLNYLGNFAINALPNFASYSGVLFCIWIRRQQSLQPVNCFVVRFSSYSMTVTRKLLN